ncbi:S-layer homology domain-containing protein [Bacillus solitudinis]|uniref:S-layer homology domain-containing protein n=1 Tax=Bacillus solitudinis TaxID=2014074 RepID=UPI000C24D5D2|nr:S-layer homology domain-containing protein [Bacillus solitudinis]
MFLKRILVLTMIGIFLLSHLSPTSSQAEETPSFDMNVTPTVYNGETVSINIKGEGITNLFAYEILFHYDPNKLAVNEIKTAIPGLPIKLIDENKGVINFSFSKLGDSAEENGKVTLATFDFKAIDLGESAVELKSVRIVSRDLSSDETYEVNLEKQIIINEKTGTPSPPGETPEPEEGTSENELIVNNDAVAIVKTKTEAGKNKVVVSVDHKKIEEALKNRDKVDRLFVKVDKSSKDEVVEVKLPLDLVTAIKDKNNGAVIEIQTEEASYFLSVNELNVEEIASQLGALHKDIEISVQLFVGEDTANVVTENNLKAASDIIEFKVEAISSDERIEINNFSAYVERTIMGETDFNPETSIAVRLNEDGTFTAIPTIFKGKQATLKSRSNSKYMVVENNGVFFSDIPSEHWAKGYIEKLASKYVIKGKNSSEYAPNDYTTRAEFAVLLARSLSLTTTTSHNKMFKDVDGTEWFNEKGELVAVVESGIVQGKEDGTFAPNEYITRAQAAAMISRALHYTSFPPTKLDYSKTIHSYKDSRQIAEWASKDVERVLQAGIMTGDEKSHFNPSEYTKRDQVAKIIHNTLQFIELMN